MAQKESSNEDKNQFLEKWVKWWAVGAASLFVLTIAGFFIWPDSQGLVIPLFLFAAVASFWFIHFWYNRFVPKGIEAAEKQNPYRKMFFSVINVLSVLLLLVGFFGAFLIMSAEDSNAYNAIALVIALIWAVVFLWVKMFRLKEPKDQKIILSGARHLDCLRERCEA